MACRLIGAKPLSQPMLRTLRTYFSENLIKIQQFSLKKMHMKMSSAKWRPSCLGLNVLTLSAASGWMDWGWGGSIHPSIHPLAGNTDWISIHPSIPVMMHACFRNPLNSRSLFFRKVIANQIINIMYNYSIYIYEINHKCTSENGRHSK